MFLFFHFFGDVVGREKKMWMSVFNEARNTEGTTFRRNLLGFKDGNVWSRYWFAGRGRREKVGERGKK